MLSLVTEKKIGASNSVIYWLKFTKKEIECTPYTTDNLSRSYTQG